MIYTTLTIILLLLTNYECKPTKDFLSSLDKQSETPTPERVTNEKDQQTLNTDLALSLPISQEVGLTKAQKHLIKMKKDPIRYKEFRERRQKSSKKYRTKNSTIDPLTEKGKLLRANKAASRSKAYFKARQKYGVTALKQRFEVEQLREKIKQG